MLDLKTPIGKKIVDWYNSMRSNKLSDEVKQNDPNAFALHFTNNAHRYVIMAVIGLFIVLLGPIIRFIPANTQKQHVINRLTQSNISVLGIKKISFDIMTFSYMIHDISFVLNNPRTNIKRITVHAPRMKLSKILQQMANIYDPSIIVESDQIGENLYNTITEISQLKHNINIVNGTMSFQKPSDQEPEMHAYNASSCMMRSFECITVTRLQVSSNRYREALTSAFSFNGHNFNIHYHHKYNQSIDIILQSDIINGSANIDLIKLKAGNNDQNKYNIRIGNLHAFYNFLASNHNNIQSARQDSNDTTSLEMDGSIALSKPNIIKANGNIKIGQYSGSTTMESGKIPSISINIDTINNKIKKPEIVNHAPWNISIAGLSRLIQLMISKNHELNIGIKELYIYDEKLTNTQISYKIQNGSIMISKLYTDINGDKIYIIDKLPYIHQVTELTSSPNNIGIGIGALTHIDKPNTTSSLPSLRNSNHNHALPTTSKYEGQIVLPLSNIDLNIAAVGVNSSNIIRLMELAINQKRMFILKDNVPYQAYVNIKISGSKTLGIQSCDIHYGKNSMLYYSHAMNTEPSNNKATKAYILLSNVDLYKIISPSLLNTSYGGDLFKDPKHKDSQRKLDQYGQKNDHILHIIAKECNIGTMAKIDALDIELEHKGKDLILNNAFIDSNIISGTFSRIDRKSGAERTIKSIAIDRFNLNSIYSMVNDLRARLSGDGSSCVIPLILQSIDKQHKFKINIAKGMAGNSPFVIAADGVVAHNSIDVDSFSMAIDDGTISFKGFVKQDANNFQYRVSAIHGINIDLNKIYQLLYNREGQYIAGKINFSNGEGFGKCNVFLDCFGLKKTTLTLPFTIQNLIISNFGPIMVYKELMKNSNYDVAKVSNILRNTDSVFNKCAGILGISNGNITGRDILLQTTGVSGLVKFIFNPQKPRILNLYGQFTILGLDPRAKNMAYIEIPLDINLTSSLNSPIALEINDNQLKEYVSQMHRIVD